MPASKIYVTLFDNVLVPAGTLAGSPIEGAKIDVGTLYGGELTWRIQNSGAIGAPCVIMFQISQNGVDWYDYEPASSKDLSSGTVSQGPSFQLRRGPMWVRAIAYGNTTSACNVTAGAHLTTGL